MTNNEEQFSILKKQEKMYKQRDVYVRDFLLIGRQNTDITETRKKFFVP
jgi:hypothetical protein